MDLLWGTIIYVVSSMLSFLKYWQYYRFHGTRGNIWKTIWLIRKECSKLDFHSHGVKPITTSSWYHCEVLILCMRSHGTHLLKGKKTKQNRSKEVPGNAVITEATPMVMTSAQVRPPAVMLDTQNTHSHIGGIVSSCSCGAGAKQLGVAAGCPNPPFLILENSHAT